MIEERKTDEGKIAELL